MAIYDIDLLRAVFVDKLNDSSIFLASFYEQIEDEQSVSRYVANIKDMIALQNREKSVSNYKAMGIVSQTGQAEILNIKTNYVTPLEYQVRLDIELADRDYVLGKIKTLIDDTRGSKFDVLVGGNGTIYPTANPNGFNGTKPILQNKCFVFYSGDYNWITAPNDLITDLKAYYEFPGSNFSVYMDGNDGDTLSGLYRLDFTYTAPSTYAFTQVKLQNTFEKYKLSLSFNGIQSDEPFINNGLDRVFLFFGGSATLVKNNVALGNDIVLTTIQVGKDTGTVVEVEPLEIPSSLNLNDDSYQLYASGYQSVDRNMAIQNKLNYSFVYDRSNSLFNDLYKFSRYGSGTGTLVSPVTGYTNQIFTIKEYRYAFGVREIDTFYAKISESGVQNTNGDVLTLTLGFKVGAY